MTTRPQVWISLGLRGINEQNFEQLRNYPIDGIRINTGRISLEWATTAIEELSRIGYPISKIYLDIGNKKTRVAFRNNQKTHFRLDQVITIGLNNCHDVDYWIDSESFFHKILANDIIYFSDGEFQGKIISKSPDRFSVIFRSDCTLAPNVAIGIVGKDFSHFHIDDSDRINELLNRYPINLIVSFVEDYSNLVETKGKFPKALSIIPKIETLRAVKNIDDITCHSSMVFIGRGDLGLSVGIEKVGVVQRFIIQSAQKHGCKVAVGTGILESLRYNDNPYRAEVIDISNLCYENVDAIVMTSETANNANPFRVLDFLFKEIDYVVNHDDFSKL